MSPTAYSGRPARKVTAKANIKTGPTTQLRRSERERIFTWLKTRCSSSYFTRAKGGYIIRIRPSAIGIEVVPTWKAEIHAVDAGARYP
jgi:hypothetical protein